MASDGSELRNVLDYASPPPPPLWQLRLHAAATLLRRGAVRSRRAALVMLLATAGYAAGRALEPASYRAAALVEVKDYAVWGRDVFTLDPSTRDARTKDALTSFRSAATLEAAAAKMRSDANPITAPDILQNLNVQMVRNTHLIEVAYIGRTPRQAMTVANSILDACDSVDVLTVHRAIAPNRRFRRPDFPRVGLIAGAFVGVVIVALRWK